MPPESRKSILGAANTEIKVLALGLLVVEATFLGSMALMKDKVFDALVVCSVIFAITVIGVTLIKLADLKNKRKTSTDIVQSGLTKDSPLLYQIMVGAVQTVCRGVTVPRTPEEAGIRAFIFQVEGSHLVCTHYWAPANLLVREQVNVLSFPLERSLADDVVVVRAYFDKQPVRTAPQSLSKAGQGIKGHVNEDLQFVLAAPITNKDGSVWGVVDLDASNDVGRALLSNGVSNNVMYHLAAHLRLLFSLTEQNPAAAPLL
jgi:hypothetical protein